MASDKLHKIRKLRAEADFKRRSHFREQHENFLIVCEGDTEEAYFKNAVQLLSLHKKRLTVLKSDGTDAVSIVNYAISTARASPLGFDNIYCVFDEVGCGNLSQARSIYESAKKEDHLGNFSLITSSPCFEFWILCHFVMSTRPYNNDADICKALREHINSYQKPMNDLFSTLQDKLPTAISNAKQVNACLSGTGATNPNTNIYVLIEHLLRESNK